MFIGCSASESHEAWSADVEGIVGYQMTGCTRSMFANRLSYTFDFKGPSFAIDTACSSSLLALDEAMLAIRAGQCDAAIVGGTSLCLKPSTTLQFQRLGMLAPDGTCKSYDVSGMKMLLKTKFFSHNKSDLMDNTIRCSNIFQSGTNITMHVVLVYKI